MLAIVDNIWCAETRPGSRKIETHAPFAALDMFGTDAGAPKKCDDCSTKLILRNRAHETGWLAEVGELDSDIRFSASNPYIEARRL